MIDNYENIVMEDYEEYSALFSNNDDTINKNGTTFQLKKKPLYKYKNVDPKKKFKRQHSTRINCPF